MNKRIIIAVLIAFAVVVGATALWSASTVERDGDTDANVIEDSGSPTGPAVAKKNGGNKVARIISAPFKAFGRLFSHKNKDNAKLQRMTEKDADKFESVGVTRVEDSRYTEAKQGIEGSAKEHLAAGRAFLKDGQLNEAIGELSTAASMDPKLAEAHNLLAVAFDQKGLHDRARESFAKAVRAEPEDAQILNNL